MIFILCIGALFFIPTKSTEEERPLTDNSIDTIIVSDTVIIHIKAPSQVEYLCVHPFYAYKNMLIELGAIYKVKSNQPNPFEEQKYKYIKVFDFKDGWVKHSIGKEINGKIHKYEHVTEAPDFALLYWNGEKINNK